VQHRQHDFRGRPPAFVHVHRNPAPVVHHSDGVVDVDGDRDVLAESGQRFVDRVVNDLVDQVMQPGRSRGPDVHRRALPDGLEALQHLDFVGLVVVGAAGHNRPGARRCLAVLVGFSL
jgi:hypothetical protein